MSLVRSGHAFYAYAIVRLVKRGCLKVTGATHLLWSFSDLSEATETSFNFAGLQDKCGRLLLNGFGGKSEIKIVSVGGWFFRLGEPTFRSLRKREFDA